MSLLYWATFVFPCWNTSILQPSFWPHHWGQVRPPVMWLWNCDMSLSLVFILILVSPAVAFNTNLGNYLFTLWFYKICNTMNRIPYVLMFCKLLSISSLSFHSSFSAWNTISVVNFFLRPISGVPSPFKYPQHFVPLGPLSNFGLVAVYLVCFYPLYYMKSLRPNCDWLLPTFSEDFSHGG